MINTYQLRRFADNFDTNTVFKVTSSNHLLGYESTFNFFKKNIIDFIQLRNYRIVSLVTGNNYDAAATFDTITVDYDKNQRKAVIKTKQTLEYNIDYYIVRALDVQPIDVLEKNQNILLIYKKKLLKFIKSRISDSNNGFTQKDYDDIESITDYPFLLQFFPKNSFFYDNDFKHHKKLHYFNYIRRKLYNLFFSDKVLFKEMWAEDLAWLKSCKRLFKDQSLTSTTQDVSYLDLNITQTEKPEFVNQARAIWHEQIKNAREAALKQLAEESVYPTNLTDQNILREIEAIKKHVTETTNDEIINQELEKKHTVIDILRFWPEILAPAPSQYYPY